MRGPRPRGGDGAGGGASRPPQPRDEPPPIRVARAALALCALALALTEPARAGDAPKQPMLGEPAPSFRLKDVMTGQAVSLEDLRGRFIVLHFGASW